MIKNFFSFIWEITKVVLIALIIVLPVRYFLFQPFIVSGYSMEPSYSNGDYLIVDEISYRFREPERGEVVVFRYPEDPTLRHIKRIVGLPGEEIVIDDSKIKIIYTNGQEITLNESDYLDNFKTGEKIEISLGPSDYFVLGDNRAASFDSRRWGSLPRDYIIGRAVIRVFPVSDFGILRAPQY